MTLIVTLLLNSSSTKKKKKTDVDKFDMYIRWKYKWYNKWIKCLCINKYFIKTIGLHRSGGVHQYFVKCNIPRTYEFNKYCKIFSTSTTGGTIKNVAPNVINLTIYLSSFTIYY